MRRMRRRPWCGWSPEATARKGRWPRPRKARSVGMRRPVACWLSCWELDCGTTPDATPGRP
jgi:hypothetical protein